MINSMPLTSFNSLDQLPARWKERVCLVKKFKKNKKLKQNLYEPKVKSLKHERRKFKKNYVPAMQKRCGQTGEAPEMGHKDDQNSGKPAMWRKAGRTWFYQPWEKKTGGTLSPYFSIQKVATNERKNPFLKWVTWKRWQMMGTSYSYRDSNWTQEANFSQ